MTTDYRRLLLSYPRWHRRLHGQDMLTTLEDCAAAGRPVSVWRLVLDGLRCRLRVRGVAARLAAACVSVVAGLAVAAGVSGIMWQATAKPWPSVAEATRFAEPVLPPGAPDEASRRDQTVSGWLDDTDSFLMKVTGLPEPDHGGVRLIYRQPTADWKGAVARAHDGAVAAGWRPIATNARGFAVRHDGMLVQIVVYEDLTQVSVYPDAPAAAYRWGWIGLAVGAVLGWLAAAAAIARDRRRLPPIRTFTLLATLAGVLLSAPACMLNAAALVIGSRTVDFLPPWLGYEFFLARPCAVLGAASLGAAWLATVIADGRLPRSLAEAR